MGETVFVGEEGDTSLKLLGSTKSIGFPMLKQVRVLGAEIRTTCIPQRPSLDSMELAANMRGVMNSPTQPGLLIETAS